MQTVSAQWTAEERDPTRSITELTEISWKKSLTGSNRTNYKRYQYEDETSRLQGLSIEREFNQPIGGVTKAMADLRYENTSGRYTPRYLGGTSAIYTAIEPR